MKATCVDPHPQACMVTKSCQEHRLLLGPLASRMPRYDPLLQLLQWLVICFSLARQLLWLLLFILQIHNSRFLLTNVIFDYSLIENVLSFDKNWQNAETIGIWTHVCSLCPLQRVIKWLFTPLADDQLHFLNYRCPIFTRLIIKYDPFKIVLPRSLHKYLRYILTSWTNYCFDNKLFSDCGNASFVSVKNQIYNPGWLFRQTKISFYIYTPILCFITALWSQA